MSDPAGWRGDGLRFGLRRRLHAMGYRPVPACGKAVYLPHWREAAKAADEDDFRRWETTFDYPDPRTGEAKTYRGDRHTNTGIACGEVVGVDIDVPVPGLAEKVEALARRILGATPLRRIGKAPKVLLAYRAAVPLRKMETPELFRPDGTKAQVEVLGEGQQFVAYGVHPDTGREYEWPEAGPDVVPLADLPAAEEHDLRAFLAAAEEVLRAEGFAPKERDGGAGRAADGSAGHEIPRPRPDDSCGLRSGTGGGSFFAAVNQAAFDNLGAWVPKLFPQAKLQATGAYRVTSADLGRGYEEDLSIHPAGVRDFGPRKGMSPCDVVLEWGGAATVQRAAFALCERLGRDPADFGWKAPPGPGTRKAEAPPQDHAVAKPKARNAKPTEADPTEDGVALAFAAEHAGRVVFDHTERRWAEWDGNRWRRDGKERVFNRVREHVRLLRESRGHGAPRALARMGFAAAVERGVRADPRIAVEHDVWDADPLALGVPGGVVDLRRGELRAGRPEEYISRQTSVAPVTPGTPAPLWNAFLEQATSGDADTIGFLRRFAGYCLTGEVSEEVMAFLYGPGGNGKGVFLGVLTAILGDYAVSMPMEAFTANGGVRLEYYRAQMAGHRLVTASETETGATWAEGQIKELTGNEAPVSARHPHGRPFTYRPGFKLCIVGNHAPRLKGRSAAMERRLRVVPFDHTPPEPDHGLKARLRDEHPAILRWMLDGCLEWRRDRLGTSPAIAKATGSYFEAQDAFGRWLVERCILDPILSARPGALQADFAAWTQANGELSTLAPAVFREAIERTNGLKYVTNQGRQWVRGIGLSPPEEGRSYP